MLQDIINLVKDKASKHFVDKTEVPNEKAEEVAEAAGESIFETLKDAVMEGDIEGLKNILSGKNADGLKEEPKVKGIMDKLSEKIQEKTGVTKEVADTAAESSVPELMEEVSGKFASEKEEDAAFDIKEMMGKIGSAEGRDDLLSQADEMFDQAKDAITDTLGDVAGKLGGMFGKKS